MNHHCFHWQGILESVFVYIQILDLVLPWCLISRGLMCSGVVMRDRVYDPSFSVDYLHFHLNSEIDMSHLCPPHPPLCCHVTEEYP